MQRRLRKRLLNFITFEQNIEIPMGIPLRLRKISIFMVGFHYVLARGQYFNLEITTFEQTTYIAL